MNGCTIAKNKEYKVVGNKKYYLEQLSEFQYVHVHGYYKCFLMCAMKVSSNAQGWKYNGVGMFHYYSNRKYNYSSQLQIGKK